MFVLENKEVNVVIGRWSARLWVVNRLVLPLWGLLAIIQCTERWSMDVGETIKALFV
jgi:hypothetical protein